MDRASLTYLALQQYLRQHRIDNKQQEAITYAETETVEVPNENFKNTFISNEGSGNGRTAIHQ
jgi:hypothetical protein